MKTPLKMIALDYDRTGNLAVLLTLPGRPDIDDEGPGSNPLVGLVRSEPDQTGASSGQKLVDRCVGCRHDATRRSGAGASGSSVHIDASFTSWCPSTS